MTVAEPEPSTGPVRIELTDEPTLAPGAPTAGSAPAGGSGKGATLAIGFTVAILLAGLWWLSRPEPGRTAADEPIAVPTTLAAPSSTAPPDSDAAAAVDGSTSRSSRIVDPIESPVRAELGWFGIQGPGPERQLVRSLDGVHWSPIPSGLPGTLHDLAERDGELVALVGEVMVDRLDPPGTASQLTIYRSTDGSHWERVQSVGPFQLDSDRVLIGRIGPDTRSGAIVAQTVPDEPLPEVSAALAPVVGEQIADLLCRIDASGFGPDYAFSLLACNGQTLATLSWADLDSGDQQLLELAALVLDSSFVIHALHGDDGYVRHAFPPGRLVVNMVPAGDGFVAIAIDTVSALEHPDRLVTFGLQSSLLTWTAAAGIRTLDDAPAILNLGQGTGLFGRADGRIVLTTPNGALEAEAPFDTWTAIDEGPNGPIPVTGRISVSADGQVLVYSDDTPGRIWLSRRGTVWREVDIPFPPFPAIDQVLVVSRDHVVVVSGSTATRVSWPERFPPRGT